MPLSPSILLEESVQIAWEYLERTGAIDDPSDAIRFLSSTIEAMIRQGTSNRLLLSNRAISAYEKRNLGLNEEAPSRFNEWPRPR
jgi:hypothetical protein